jgi:hypothetical protein
MPSRFLSGLRRSWVLVVAILLGLVSALDAEAAPARKKKRRGARRPEVPSGPIEVPVEVSIGPVALVPNPPALFDQPVHAGVMIDVAAVVDRTLIRRYRNKLPAWARGVASSVNEVKLAPGPLAFIPETLIVSPGFASTGMYGAIWRPIGVSIPLVDTPAFHIEAGAALSAIALFVHSSTLGVTTSATDQAFTFVLRPGLQLRVAAEVPLSDVIRLNAGWSSDLMVPQPWGRPPWELFPLENSLWHLGGPFFTVAYRFPYRVDGM